jgi:hypothetical protein
MQDQLAWGLTTKIEELEHDVVAIIQHYARAAIRSLTSYPYFVQAANALLS